MSVFGGGLGEHSSPTLPQTPFHPPLRVYREGGAYGPAFSRTLNPLKGLGEGVWGSFL